MDRRPHSARSSCCNDSMRNRLRSNLHGHDHDNNVARARCLSPFHRPETAHHAALRTTLAPSRIISASAIRLLARSRSCARNGQSPRHSAHGQARRLMPFSVTPDLIRGPAASARKGRTRSGVPDQVGMRGPSNSADPCGSIRWRARLTLGFVANLFLLLNILDRCGLGRIENRAERQPDREGRPRHPAFPAHRSFRRCDRPGQCDQKAGGEYRGNDPFHCYVPQSALSQVGSAGAWDNRPLLYKTGG